jgi:hypothetical protein
MSRASRRARGRQTEAARQPQSETATYGATRQIGALRVGLTESSIAIDASKLEAPTNAYDADVAWVEYRPGRLSLIFAKRDRDEANFLKSRLEVRYPPEDFINTFWSNSTAFFERLRTYVGVWPREAREGAVRAPIDLPAKQSHSEWANYAYMAHSGSEASIDLYHLASASLARYAQNRNLEGIRLRGVVRVQLTSFDLLDLIDQLQSLVDEITRTLPEPHRAMAAEIERASGQE